MVLTSAIGWWYEKMCVQTDPWPQKSSTRLGLGFANVPIRPTPGWLFNEIIRDVRDLRVAPITSSCRIRHFSYEVRNNPKDWQWKAVHTWSHAPEVQFFPLGLCSLMYFCKENKFEWVEIYALLFVRHLDSECQVCDSLCKCSTADSVFSSRVSSWGHSRCGRVFDAVRVQWSAQHPT